VTRAHTGGLRFGSKGGPGRRGSMHQGSQLGMVWLPGSRGSGGRRREWWSPASGVAARGRSRPASGMAHRAVEDTLGGSRSVAWGQQLRRRWADDGDEGERGDGGGGGVKFFGAERRKEEGGKEKGKTWFPNPAIFIGGTRQPGPLIFVGEATSPTNISHVYSSVM
jgi:hypothetical protein